MTHETDQWDDFPLFKKLFVSIWSWSTYCKLNCVVLRTLSAILEKLGLRVDLFLKSKTRTIAKCENWNQYSSLVPFQFYLTSCLSYMYTNVLHLSIRFYIFRSHDSQRLLELYSKSRFLLWLDSKAGKLSYL